MFLTKEDLNNKNNTLKRAERLKSKKIITSLFDKKEGSFFVCKPVIVAYKIISTDEYNLPQVAFTVSKSKFKRAIDRNRIKRLMREAYRTQKHPFLEKLKVENKTFALMFVFNSFRMEDTDKIEDAVKKALLELRV